MIFKRTDSEKVSEFNVNSEPNGKSEKKGIFHFNLSVKKTDQSHSLAVNRDLKGKRSSNVK
jgi:hypothetical protein